MYTAVETFTVIGAEGMKDATAPGTPWKSLYEVDKETPPRR